VKNEEVEKIFRSLDTRITTINDRTKAHTLEIGELKKRVKELEEKNEI
jgi:predicted  nucleic acid-binding Zn-ribbon protein